MQKQETLTKVKKPLKREIVAKQLDPDLVRRCAYEIFEERSQHNIPGDQLSDWLKAEAELKSSLRIK
jgi:hypothetical protein